MRRSGARITSPGLTHPGGWRSREANENFVGVRPDVKVLSCAGYGRAGVVAPVVFPANRLELVT